MCIFSRNAFTDLTLLMWHQEERPVCKQCTGEVLAWLSVCSEVQMIMAALCNRAGHYIFALWILSSFFFSSPNLGGRRLDVYHTSTHVVALVRI